MQCALTIPIIKINTHSSPKPNPNIPHPLASLFLCPHCQQHLSSHFHFLIAFPSPIFSLRHATWALALGQSNETSVKITMTCMFFQSSVQFSVLILPHFSKAMELRTLSFPCFSDITANSHQLSCWLVISLCPNFYDCQSIEQPLLRSKGTSINFHSI